MLLIYKVWQNWRMLKNTREMTCTLILCSQKWFVVWFDWYPWGRMLHDVSFLYIFNFFIKIIEYMFVCFYIFVSPERELWLTPGMGMEGGGQQIITNHKKSLNKYLFLYVSHRNGILTDAGDEDGGSLKKTKKNNIY